MARGPYFSYRPGGLGDRIFGGEGLANIQRELHRVIEELDIPTRMASQGGGGTGHVPLDIVETPDALTVHADLPGVAEDDVHITLDEDMLTVTGERRAPAAGERQTAHRTERPSGAFQRNVKLPSPVDPEAVTADFAHGVLTITLPKPKPGAKARKIQVRTAAAATASAASVAAASSDATTAGGATGGTPMSGSVTGGAGGSAEGAGGFGFIQGDGAQGPTPSTGVGDAPSSDIENAAKPGGAVHGYNE